MAFRRRWWIAAGKRSRSSIIFDAGNVTLRVQSKMPAARLVPIGAEEAAREWTVRGLRHHEYPIGNRGCETDRWSRPRIAPVADGSARNVVASEATAGLLSLARPVGLAMLTTTTCFAAVQTGTSDNDPRRRQARADP